MGFRNGVELNHGDYLAPMTRNWSDLTFAMFSFPAAFNLHLYDRHLQDESNLGLMHSKQNHGSDEQLDQTRFYADPIADNVVQ
jgi:hypothetical protein